MLLITISEKTSSMGRAHFVSKHRGTFIILPPSNLLFCYIFCFVLLSLGRLDNRVPTGAAVNALKFFCLSDPGSSYVFVLCPRALIP